MAAFSWRQRQEWRRITPRLWLSSGRLLALDLEYYIDGGRQKFDSKIIEDFAKARDDLYAQIKKQMLLSFLVFIFLGANYFKVGLDINIGGFSLRYAPGVPEGLLLELCAEVGDGMKGKAAYRGGVLRLHFSTEGVIRRDRD